MNNYGDRTSLRDIISKSETNEIENRKSFLDILKESDPNNPNDDFILKAKCEDCANRVRLKEDYCKAHAYPCRLSSKSEEEKIYCVDFKDKLVIVENKRVTEIDKYIKELQSKIKDLTVEKAKILKEERYHE